MTRLDIERLELRNFTAGVSAETARNLEILRAIESTLAWLERLTGQLRADFEFADKVNANLAGIPGIIDPDDSIQQGLEKAQIAVEELYGLLISKRQSGRDDHRLMEEDGIEEAYTEAIAAAADLHNAINSLRWNIGEHDTDAEPKAPGKTYAAEDIDKMFDDLLVP